MLAAMEEPERPIATEVDFDLEAPGRSSAEGLLDPRLVDFAVIGRDEDLAQTVEGASLRLGARFGRDARDEPSAPSPSRPA
jgi:hypothetical protein